MRAEQELTDLIETRRQLKALLAGDHVLVRKGMMVVATQETVPHHQDAVKSAERLGEVLLVMRLGGRHMQWGEPQTEQLAAMAEE